MTEERRREHVALRRASRQTGRWAHPLNVPDHRRNLHVIRQARKLRHQRDAWPSGCSHRSRPRPGRPNHHAHGRQFVFRLHNGKGRFTIRPDAVFLHVIDHRLHQRRRRRNWIPRHHRTPGKHASHRRRRITVDDDLALRLVHALDAERIALLQVRDGIIMPRLGRRQIQRSRLGLGRKLLADCLLDLGIIDFQQLRCHADIDHVLDQFAQLGFRAHRRRQFVERYGVINQIVAHLIERQRFVVNHGRARRQRLYIVLRRLRIHRDEQVDFFLARNVAIFTGADRVPGRQPRNVRRKHVLPRNRHAHLENAAQQNRVRTLRPRSVHGRNLNAHVVNDTLLPQLP